MSRLPSRIPFAGKGLAKPLHLIYSSLTDFVCTAGTASVINLDEHDAAAMGSERSFGLVFAAVFAAVGSWPLLTGSELRWWALAIAFVFVLAALLIPRILVPLNRIWFRIGLLLGRIAGPVVMALIFFGAVVPTALVMKLRRKDLLRLKPDRDADTYWIKRDDSVAGSMHDQF